MDTPGVFNVRYTSTFSPDRVYRVYVLGSDLYFIRIGGQHFGFQEGLRGGALQGGLIGALLGELFIAMWEGRAGKKKKTLIRTFDQDHPELLVDRHKHSFRLNAVDLRESTIEGPARFATHGPQAGRWKSVLGDGKELNLEFPTDEDLEIALRLLPPVVGSVLAVNVQREELSTTSED